MVEKLTFITVKNQDEKFIQSNNVWSKKIRATETKWFGKNDLDIKKINSSMIPMKYI